MKKTLLIVIAMIIVTNTTFAGGLLTNTNQNIAFLRNPARGASTQIDAVYSNPAGLAFLEDGFHISLNGQSAYQTRTIKSTFAPLAGFGGSDTKTYKGEASAPFIPSLQAAYKKGDWAFSGSFAVTGGGGKATFNHGLASFESLISLLPALTTGATGGAIKADKYSVDSYMEGSQIIYGLQLGATYKITDYLSAFVGARMNYVSNGYVGHLKNIQFNAKHPQLNPTGEMVSANKFFTAAGPGYEKFANLTADKELDCDQSGWGVTPIIGADFKMGKWNLGVKYEFNTKLNVENKTKIDGTGLFADGVNTPHDIPSLLTVGASYEILPVLRASVGYHHFFDTHAKMASNKQDFLSGGTHEYLGGLEWDITKWAQVSAGMQRTKYGVEDNFQSDMSFSVSSYSYGFGAGFMLVKNLKLNVAYFFTNYDTYTKDMEDYNNLSTQLSKMNIAFPKTKGTDVFTRTNKVFGIGLDYKF